MRVGVTGISSDLGQALLPRLDADPEVQAIVAVDVEPPPTSSRKLQFVRIDLTRPDAEADLITLFRSGRLDALYHLAFVNSRVHGAAFAHELEVIGTLHVLAAAQACGLPRLIIPSLTAVYGARRDGVSLHAEHQPLHGAGARFVLDRVEVEHQAAQFAHRNPDTHLLVLRFAPIVGPQSDNPFTRLVRNRMVPTALGFDPLWQVVHESDAGRALHLALTTAASGAFNIVCAQALPLSALLRLAGASATPLPTVLFRATIRALELAGVASVPMPLLDYLKYPWLADGRRAQALLGFTAHTDVRRAMASLVANKE
jgi:UDP-glucose 4-epimerase